MDGVLVDFQSGIDALGEGLKEVYNERWDECPDIFSKMEPMFPDWDSILKLMGLISCQRSMIHIYYQQHHGTTLLLGLTSTNGW